MKSEKFSDTACTPPTTENTGVIQGFQNTNCSKTLGQNNVPILDQKSWGTCATFALTAAIDMTLSLGDYISQFCLLELSKTLSMIDKQYGSFRGSDPAGLFPILQQYGLIAKPIVQQCNDAAYDASNSNRLPPSMREDTYRGLAYYTQSVSNRLAGLTLTTYGVGDPLPVGMFPLTLDTVRNSINSGNYFLIMTQIYLVSDVVQPPESPELQRGIRKIISFDGSPSGAYALFACNGPSNSSSIFACPETSGRTQNSMGFHWIVVTGYDDNQGLLEIRNSWGSDFGISGIGYMTYQFFNAMVANGRELFISEITTVAGNGTAGYSGDNGPATSAELSKPSDAVFDKDGNLYIADTNNCIIRKVDTSGTISTFAGTPQQCGYFGDSGPATSAKIGEVFFITFDTAGNLYIADHQNCVVRKVDTSGTISTFAGTGTCGYNGDNILATSAQLNSPVGVAWISTVPTVPPKMVNTLLITEEGNVGEGCRIRQVVGGTIYTLVGDGTCVNSNTQVSYPWDIIYNSKTNKVYFISPKQGGECLARSVSIAGVRNGNIPVASSQIKTVAGNGTCGNAGDGGPATSSELFHPVGIATDVTGDVYITTGCSIRYVSLLNETISTVAGTGTCGYNGDGFGPTVSEINEPVGITVDEFGYVYFADSGNNRVRRFH